MALKNECKITKEFNLIGDMLPFLLYDGLITQLESDDIKQTINFSDRFAAVYRLLMTKSNEDSLKLLEMFRKMTLKIYHEESSRVKESSKEEVVPKAFDEAPVINISSTPTVENKGFWTNNMIIQNIFGVLSVEDIKSCRLVNQQWNSIAQPLLSKQTLIHFNNESLRPATFNGTITPNLPFTQFKFSSSDRKQKMWRITEIGEFFNNFGSNITKLEFKDFRLSLYPIDGRHDFRHYDATPWIEKTPRLLKLKIDGDGWGTRLSIPIENLTRITSLDLTNCFILFSPCEEIIRLAPSKISLAHVGFKKNREIVNNCFLNDFFDFSKISKIIIDHSDNDINMLYFNMEDCELNAKYLFLISPNGASLVNWEKAKGKISLMSVYEFCFYEKNNLEIKHLISSNSIIILTALPQTIEKLVFSKGSQIICNEIILLPHLNYLYFEIFENNIHSIAHFAKCVNLVELELDAKEITGSWTLNLGLIPKSVEKMKINGYCNLRITDNDCTIALDVLIIEDSKNSFADVVGLVRKIQPKVLVMKLTWCETMNTEEILHFVVENRRLSKIVFGCLTKRDLHNNQYEDSFFSNFVDEKSNYYLFKDQLGQALTSQEFVKWTKMNRPDPVAFSRFRY